MTVQASHPCWTIVGEDGSDLCEYCAEEAVAKVACPKCLASVGETCPLGRLAWAVCEERITAALEALPESGGR